MVQISWSSLRTARLWRQNLRPRLSKPSSRKPDPSLLNGGVRREPMPTTTLGGSIGHGFFAGDAGDGHFWPAFLRGLFGGGLKLPCELDLGIGQSTKVSG